MNHLFCENLDEIATIYRDNYLIFIYSIEEHEAYLYWVFN